MKTLVQRWGNSLAVRIPKAYAKEIEVSEGDEVEMAVAKRKLVIIPRTQSEYHLRDLIAEINPGNVHREISVDRPLGGEAW